MTLTLLSPAKINLFLRVLSKRADGYHELASLFQAVSLCDTLRFSLQEIDEIICSDPQIPLEKNSVKYAVDLFRQKTDIHFGIRIEIEKKIPKEAGLGGGSSNAATTLFALNTLLGFPASFDELIEWSQEIGSDVPFFLTEGTAYCTGRGEKMKKLSPLPSQSLWIVKPKEGLSTPKIFSCLDLSRLEGRDPKEQLSHCLSGSFSCFNDLEQPAFQVLPKLKELKSALLRQGFSRVVMSGAGSSLFCLGGKEAPQIEQVSMWRCQFLNRKPSEWYSNSLL